MGELKLYGYAVVPVGFARRVGVGGRKDGQVMDGQQGGMGGGGGVLHSAWGPQIDKVQHCFYLLLQTHFCFSVFPLLKHLLLLLHCKQNRVYLLVYFTLPLQVFLVDEMVGNLFYSSPGIIILFLVHLPKTALCERGGGVRHLGHVATGDQG